MDYIELFAGIGGFSVGLEKVGFQCVAQVEINRYCNLVLERHFPSVLRIKDVKEAGKHNLPAARLVVGGSPCQDVSVAGRRAGLAGKRSGLFFEFIRILEEVKPEWFIFENVAGLLSSNQGRDFATVLFSMVKCGYSVSYRVFDSQYFGVPQRRRRVFIVGHLGTGRAAQVLFESESLSRDSSPVRKVRDTSTGDLKGLLGRGSEEFSFDTAQPIAPTLTASGGGTLRPAGQRNEAGFLVPFKKVSSHEFQDTPIGSTLMARDFKDFGDLVVVKMDNTHSNVRTQETVAYEKGVRRFTLTECERLQGFPDDWTKWDKDGHLISDTQRGKMLGNAVTTTVIEWIGRRIMAVENSQNDFARQE